MALFGGMTKRFGPAVTISMIVHGALALVFGFYLAYSKIEVVHQVVTSFLEPLKQEAPKPRPEVIKPMELPIVPQTPVYASTPIVAAPTTGGGVGGAPRTIGTGKGIGGAVGVGKFAAGTVGVGYTGRYRGGISTQAVNVPGPILGTAKVSPGVVTDPTVTTPGDLTYTGPSGTGTGVGGGSGFGEGGGSGIGIGRGLVGVQAKVARGIETKLQGISMVETVRAAEASTVLNTMAAAVTIGNLEVPPLPKGEPGGKVIGKGKDITGVLRLVRVRHELSDWWADASSLNALTKWLNERTKIKTDMNVEGGAVKITDPNLLKSPIAFMTGHDPALTRSRSLNKGGRLDNRFSEAEKTALRKYLIEKGGLLVFDDCGVNAPAQAMIKLFIAQMRYVMPEYQIERLQNDNEVYNNFYEMGGPPVGFDIFWWGTHPPKRNFLEGVSVGNRLAVLVVRRDYMCAMESVSLPTRAVHYSPGVYRFMTNVVVYALTHGGISEYGDYVPETTIATQLVPREAPQSTKIDATGQ